jgi:transposase
MSVLSQDLRQRILNYALTHSVRQTARLFQVSPDTVYRLKKLYYETGGVSPRTAHVAHAHAVSPEGDLYLQTLLLDDVDLTLDELCGRYEDVYGVRVGTTTMHETIKRLKYSYKKKTFYDPKRDADQAKDEKLSYISQLEGVEPEDRVYLDETGSALNLNLEYGRSRRGERVYDKNPVAPGGTLSTAALLTEKGIEAVSIYGGHLTAKRFIFYLEIYVLDLLLAGKVLIMDNHPAHCAKCVQKFLDGFRVSYIYLPTYSPELNPIEEAFSKTKHYIRKHKPRTFEALFSTIRSAVKTVTQDDVIGYVNHSEEFLEVTC